MEQPRWGTCLCTIPLTAHALLLETLPEKGQKVVALGPVIVKREPDIKVRVFFHLLPGRHYKWNVGTAAPVRVNYVHLCC